MAEENKVVLHGLWSSTNVKRVELALKIKGIPSAYVEEDVLNKGPLLLKYNPVHKKVPVLGHNGKPNVESLVILEYVDEMWRNESRLLPQDPYERARTRFWAGYVQQGLGRVFGIKILDPEKHPMMHQWVTTLMELPVVKDDTPSHDSLVSFFCSSSGKMD
ncbi:UNVERIFIED_CONTAM: Glutathione S-transferase U10 [Sesamum calycinum]|uniref:Glutathione S-transferase n=1 Tax=Sesamum calycinum TaxID=2727403 RepID=A0AAW2NII7_9LAMI